MKFILTVSVLFFATQSYAVKNVLKCLGQEEADYHIHKSLTPLYQLNQSIIEALVQIDPKIKVNDIDLICKQNEVSLIFLELLLKKERSLFTVNLKDENETRIAWASIDRLILDADILLRDYIGEIQALSPTAQCLIKAIPELQEYFNQSQHLEGEVSLKSIRPKLEVLKKLRNYKTIFENCKKETQKKT
jgi:hypothetical protein